MQDTINIPLISSEIAGMWNAYMLDSMNICIIKHFINNVDDIEVRNTIQYALDLSNQHVQVLTGIFNQEGLPVPKGFSDDDVDVNAPRLFTNSYYLLYISYMSRIGLQYYTLILNHTARADIRNYFSECVAGSVGLYNKLTDLRLTKGIFIRAPRIEVAKSVQFIESSNFIMDLFGEKRSLLAMEITYMFANMLSITMARPLAAGFGQVSKRKDIIDYMLKGIHILKKSYEIFAKVLTDEGIPIPSHSDSYVTDSTIAPFSEKLMMFIWLSIANTATINYAASMVNSLRGDLTASYIRLQEENLKYCKEGMDIMIANRWMEQPPQVISHENLVKM